MGVFVRCGLISLCSNVLQRLWVSYLSKDLSADPIDLNHSYVLFVELHFFYVSMHGFQGPKS
jgi:hypothetical protein